jgi:hypothetical protein
MPKEEKHPLFVNPMKTSQPDPFHSDISEKKIIPPNTIEQTQSGEIQKSDNPPILPLEKTNVIPEINEQVSKNTNDKYYPKEPNNGKPYALPPSMMEENSLINKTNITDEIASNAIKDLSNSPQKANTITVYENKSKEYPTQQTQPTHNDMYTQKKIHALELDQIISNANNLKTYESNIGMELKKKINISCSQLARMQYLEMAATKCKEQIAELTEQNLELKVQNMQYQEKYKGLEEEVGHLQTKIRNLETENFSYNEIKAKMERLNKEILEKNNYLERYVISITRSQKTAIISKATSCSPKGWTLWLP